MTTTTLTPRRTDAAGIGWPLLLSRTLAAEWTKLRSVRSPYGSLLAALGVTVGIAALAATPAWWAVLTAKALLLGAWAVVALAAGVVTLHRRDSRP